MSDDFIQFIEDESKNEVIDSTVKPWLIGIIDDEAAVHDVTKLALRGVTIYDRPLEFYSAYNAKEGEELLKQNPDTAVILLDVVMESDDAGLKLVDIIRNEMKNNSVQIVLRTGQPGYAPEEDVIIQYEINAYKNKNELTRNKLFTTIATAIRSYQQITAIKKSRDGLREVINASASMLQERSVYNFSSGVLNQIDALFDIASDSLFCISKKPTNAPFSIANINDDGLYVIAANNSYRKYFDTDISRMDQPEPAIELALSSLKQKKHLFGEQFGCLYLNTPSGWQGVIVAEKADRLKQADQELLQIFCMNVALGLENAKFFSYLNKAAFTDELTNLLNRAGLIEEAKKQLYQTDDLYTLYLIDIDYFHQIIASFGYQFGNTMLKNVANTITQLFDKNSIVARIHSDVFAVIIKGDNLSATDVAIKCARPITIEGQSIRLGLTVGAANTNTTSINDIPTLLRQAEMALHVAKDHKRGAGEEFNDDFEQESRKSMALLNDFRIALEQKELFLVLQPKVDIFKNSICGFEALIRWQHPEKGLIPPIAFIPGVEKSGMHYDLDIYVANALCELIKNNDFKALPISFNISANSLNYENFANELRNVFIDHKVDFDLIQIEVTENALIHSERSISRLNDLYDAGFNICLDDFGAGFSSLSYLLRLPLHTIKIDRAFVSDLVGNHSSLILLEGMLSIIKKLDKSVVVEGVETDEQLELLKGLGVETVQGFKFYKPLNLTDALALL